MKLLLIIIFSLFANSCRDVKTKELTFDKPSVVTENSWDDLTNHEKMFYCLFNKKRQIPSCVKIEEDYAFILYLLKNNGEDIEFQLVLGDTKERSVSIAKGTKQIGQLLRTIKTGSSIRRYEQSAVPFIHDIPDKVVDDIYKLFPDGLVWHKVTADNFDDFMINIVDLKGVKPPRENKR